jgi:hypothetical protein
MVLAYYHRVQRPGSHTSVTNQGGRVLDIGCCTRVHLACEVAGPYCQTLCMLYKAADHRCYFSDVLP